MFPKNTLLMTLDYPRGPTEGGHRAFQQTLDNMGLQYTPTTGRYTEEYEEYSYIIYGVTRAQAVALGTRFGQEAVVWVGDAQEFIYTHGPNTGKSHPHDPTQDKMWAEQPDEVGWTCIPRVGYARIGFNFDILLDSPA